MALKIKSTKIKDTILDEKDNEIGIIEFDPEDASVYKKFLELVNTITDYQKIDNQIGELEDIPSFELKSIEEFEKYRGVFNQLGRKIDEYIKMREKISKITDEVFGNVSEVFKQVSNSIDPYLSLIEWATPYFKKGREAKVNEYLEDNNDVM